MPIHTCLHSKIARLFLGSVLASCSLALTACDDSGASGLALSLKPFYTEADLDSDPALPGTWNDAEDGVTFTFAAPDANVYKLAVKETDGDHVSSADFEAHLVHLGNYWFLDFIPTDGPAGGTFYQMHLLRAHSFAQIDLSGESMKMSFLDADWLQKQIDAKNADVSFQKAEGTLLLTGPSKEVRDLGYRAAHEDGFSNAITLSRQEAER
jgi:hypothetical protein